MLTEPTGHPKLEHRRRIVRVARLFWTLAIAPLAFVAFAIARVLTS